MNIIQIQNQLKGLPDNIIAGYVQNPNAQVPAYLALSELQRRKTTREEYQQNQQAPQQSVAQSLTSQIPTPQMQQPQAAQQGVAALPMGNTPQPQQNFARGGIVAFADGGDVDSLTAQAEAAFNAGEYEKAKALYARSADLQEKANVGDGPTMAPAQIDQAKQQIYEQLAAQRNAPSGIYTLDENLPQENIPEVVQGLPTLTAPDFVRNIDETAGPRESAVSKIRERDKGYADYPNGEALRVADGVRNNALIGEDMIAKMKERQKAEAQDRIKGYKESTAKSNERIKAAQEAKAKGIANIRSGDLPVINIPPEIVPKTLGETTQGKGIAALPTAKQVILPPTPRAPQTALEKAQAEYRAALAPDQKTRDDLTGRMRHLDEQSKWRREHTDFDAVTKAGLAMMQAGARPGASFLGAVGAGGEAGIKSLSEARDVQYATEEKRAALEQQLTQLERAERIAIAKFGVDSEEAKMVREDKKEAERLKRELDKELNTATNTMHKYGYELAAGASKYGADARERGQANSDKAIEARMTMAENRERRQGLTTLLANAQKDFEDNWQYSKDEAGKAAARQRIADLQQALLAASEGEQANTAAPAATPITNMPQNIIDSLAKYPPKK